MSTHFIFLWACHAHVCVPWFAYGNHKTKPSDYFTFLATLTHGSYIFFWSEESNEGTISSTLLPFNCKMENSHIKLLLTQRIKKLTEMVHNKAREAICLKKVLCTQVLGKSLYIL